MCVNIGNTHQVDRGSQEKRKRERGREGGRGELGERGEDGEGSNSPPESFLSTSTASAACVLSHLSWLGFANDAARRRAGKGGDDMAEGPHSQRVSLSILKWKGSFINSERNGLKSPTRVSFSKQELPPAGG